jgi:hypothetical protein
MLHFKRYGPMKALLLATVISLSGVEVGCALFIAKETRYLLSAKDRATAEEVRRHLGQPVKISYGQSGEAVWTYEIREFVQGGNSTWGMTGSWWCDEYILTFDAPEILRDWTHTSRKCG